MEKYLNPIIEIAICDDEKYILEAVEEMCNAVIMTRKEKYNIMTFQNGSDLLAYVGHIDFVFLDVEMPQIDGFTVAQELNIKYKNIRIIFLTSHIEMIQKAFKVKAFRYLFKPCAFEQFSEAFSDVMLELLTISGFYIEKDYITTWIKYDDLYFIESIGDATTLCVKGHNIVMSKTLKYWLEELNDSFYQCHKSFIVNLSAISSCEIDRLILMDSWQIPVSVRNRKKMRETFHDFIKKKSKFM